MLVAVLGAAILLAVGSLGARSARAVGTAASSIGLSSDANPAVYGEPVTLTAVVTATAPGGVTPTGKVTFAKPGGNIATKKLVGGQVSYTTTYAVGTTPITATYDGDAVYALSQSAPLDQVVDETPTTTTLESSANPSDFATPVTFTATVAAAAPGSGTPSSGSVKFFDGTTKIGSKTPSHGVASITTTLATGTHPITATFGGSASYLASASGVLDQVANPASSATTLTTDANPSPVGSLVTLTASVAGGSGPPTGTVTFSDGPTVLATYPVTDGQAVFSTAALSPGAHTLTAAYSGSAVLAPSSGSLIQQVEPLAPVPTTTALDIGPNPATVGDTVTLTATVSASGATPPGTVTFFDGTAPLGTVDLSAGQGWLTIDTFGVGPHTLTARYDGTGSFLASTSGAVALAVDRGPTTTSLTSSANPAPAGAPVVLTATVSGATDVPTGTVTFRDGTTVIDAVPLVDGVAASTANLDTGSHTISAEFSGDDTHAPSVSDALVQVITPPPSTTTIVATPNPVVAGRPLAVTATVTSGGATPTGTVTFFDWDTDLGSAQLTNGQATISVDTLTVGVHGLSAAYSGSTAVAPSTSTAFPETVTASVVLVDKANTACRNSGFTAGSAATPFCSINSAASKVVAGQTVQVAEGTYNEKVTVSVTGTEALPIGFAPAPGATVVIAGSANGFSVTNKSWITISGFQIADTKGPGVTVSSSTHITLAGNRVSNAGSPVSGSTAPGIKLSGVVDSQVLANTTDHNTDAGILLTNESDNNVVAHNESSANARVYVRAAAGIDVRNGTGNAILANRTHDNEDSGINMWTGLADGGNVAADNVSYANGDHGIDVHNAVDAWIVANTVVGNYDSGIEMTTSTDSRLANNITVDNGIGSLRTSGDIRADAASAPTSTVNDDVLWLRVPGVMVDWGGVKYGSLAAFRAATGQESRGLEADPRFVDSTNADFGLLAGSPAIDSADSGAPGQPLTDADGAPRWDDPTPDTGIGPVAYADRGAYERHP